MTPDAPAEMPLKTLTLPPSDGVAGGDVAYFDQGEGPTVVLVHGYPGRPADYRWMVPAFEGVRVVAPALPGLDLTPIDTCPAATITGRGRFLAAFLREADVTGVVAGHSMGAAVAAIAAEVAPERVTGLGLLAPLGLRPHKAFRRSTPRLSKWLVGQPLMSWWTLPLMRRVFVAMGFARGLTDGAMVHTLDCAAAMDFDELAEVYRRLEVPCLVASADDDPLIEPAISRELVEALADAQLLAWDSGMHGVVKTRAVELAEALGGMARG